MSFWFLSTPFSKYPGGIDAAYRLACHATATLTRNRVAVFSPIVHSYALSLNGAPDHLDHKFWMDAGMPFIRAAHGLLVLQAEGTSESIGVRAEIDAFRKMGKPVRQILPEHLDAPDVIERLKDHLAMAA